MLTGIEGEIGKVTERPEEKRRNLINEAKRKKRDVRRTRGLTDRIFPASHKSTRHHYASEGGGEKMSIP